MQRRLFADVLDELDGSPDLTNQCWEVSLSEDGARYAVTGINLCRRIFCPALF
jgi:hypothetical protein